MTIITHDTTSISFLNQTNFKMVITKLPLLTDYIQSVSMPGFSVNAATMPSFDGPLYFVGDQINYDPLTISYKLDSGFKNYWEIYQWFLGMGHPQNLKQGDIIGAKSTNPMLQRNLELENKGRYSDGVLYILDANKVPISQITFRNMFPIGFSQLPFDSTASTISYITAQVSFRFQNFDIKMLTA